MVSTENQWSPRIQFHGFVSANFIALYTGRFVDDVVFCDSTGWITSIPQRYTEFGRVSSVVMDELSSFGVDAGSFNE